MIVQAGGIRTGMAAREPTFPMDPYLPLMDRFRARFDKYAGEHGGSPPHRVAEQIAELLAKGHPPPRSTVGARPERLMATLPGRARGRLMQLGLNW
jgi:hypothetical protein